MRMTCTVKIAWWVKPLCCVAVFLGPAGLLIMAWAVEKGVDVCLSNAG